MRPVLNGNLMKQSTSGYVCRLDHSHTIASWFDTVITTIFKNLWEENIT